MRKILYLLSTLRRCGPNSQLYAIVKYLNRNMYTPCIVTFSPEPQESMWNDFLTLGISISSLNLSRVKGLLFGNKKLIQIIKQINPWVVHSQGIRPDIFLANNLDYKIKMATLHNHPFEEYPINYGAIFGNLLANEHLNNLRKMTRIIAVSKHIALSLKNKNLKITAIQNGVDIEGLEQITKQNKFLIRKKLGLPLDKKIFISVGILDNRKNPLAILNVFKKSSLKDAVLIFLGDGFLRNKMMSESRELDNVFIKGHVCNVGQFLSAADFFISNSMTEGVPYSVLEALSNRLPCILSRIPAHSEILECVPEAGKFFPINNEKELERQLISIMNQDYETISEKAFSIVNRNFNAKAMSMKYQDVYDSFL